MGGPGEVTSKGDTKKFNLINDFQGRGTREVELGEEIVRYFAWYPIPDAKKWYLINGFFGFYVCIS